jgi:phage protein D/phage baseplate assembly protein gpV
MTNPAPHIGQFSIQVDGAPLPPDVQGRLDDAVVEDDLAQPAMFELRFNDPKLELLDGTLFHLGAEVRLSAAGPAGQSRRIMVGEVTALEPAMEQHNVVLVVRGYDRSHRLRRGNKTRTFLKQSDADIAGQIAREAGLGADIEPTRVQHDYVIQDTMSDWAFLQARAARIGYQVRVDDRTLRFRRAEADPLKAPPQEWGNTLLAFHARLSAAAQPSEVNVRGWDPQAKRPILGSADRPTQAAPVNERKGAGQAAEQAFSGRAVVVVGDRPVRSQAEADRVAQAILDELDGDYFAAEGRCQGEPAVRAGAVVEVKGVGKRFAGVYVITACRHEYTPRGGYMTTFYVTGRRPNSLLAAIAPGTASRIVAGVTVGIVTNVNDPDRLGRVKVRFPWLDDSHESDWARIALDGAGAGRGIFAAPQVDDEVLVAFEHGDPARPFVVGGLWNGKDRPPDDAVKPGRKLTLIRTAAGRLIVLDDTAESLTIAADGHTITLRSDGVSIESAGDMTLAANGTLTIKGKLVKIN